MTRIILAFLLLLFAAPAFAQDSEQADRSYFIGYVEGKLSAPNRQLRINNIQGVLSSDATIGEITIADREGIWLRIVNARIVWTRSALLLGRLDIDTLAAERIEILRKPVPAEGAPAPESMGFQLPDLPVSISLGKLEVPHITFGQEVFGLASEMALTGRMRLADGSLDAAIDATRLDGPGGALALAATYSNETQVLNLDFNLAEPRNGIVANALGVEGRPPMTLALNGEGPISALDLALTLDADAERVLTGTTQLRRQVDGLRFITKVEGPIARLIPPRFRAFFGATTTLDSAGLFKDAGGVTLLKLNLDTAALKVAAAGETSADGFVQRVTLDAAIGDPSGAKVVLPVAGGETTLGGAEVNIGFGDHQSSDWTGTIAVDDFSTGTFGAKAIAIEMGGVADNVTKPGERHITFKATGAATGIIATDAAVAEALGKDIRLDIEGDYNSGQPVKLAKALIEANGLSLSLAGAVADLAFNGDIALKAAALAPFSALAGRDLTGAIDLLARGSVMPLGGGFDLTLDGTARDLGIGQTAADNLLRGQTKLSGGVARGETGLAARQFRIVNDQLNLRADGTFATGAANFNFDLSVADIALLSQQASGRLTATGKASGANGLIDLDVRAAVPTGTLAGRTLSDATIGFVGALRKSDLDGQVTGSASLDGTRVELATALAQTAQGRSIKGLRLKAGGATLTGDIDRTPQGLLTGKVALAADDISTAAALLLRQATGAVDARIALSHQDGNQNAAVTANVTALTVDAIRIGNADLQADIADLFAVPIIQGKLAASDIAAAGVDVATLAATARSQGRSTDFTADARLKNGTTAALAGALAPIEGGYRLQLDKADVAQDTLAARLTAPATIETQGQVVRIGDLAIDVGGGRIAIRGEVAQTLDLTVEIKALPLAIANAIRPDLGLAGTIDGAATVGGTRQAPEIGFRLAGRSIAAAALRQAGVQSLSVDANGKSTAQRLDIDASLVSPEGLRATVKGAVPLDKGDLALDVELAAFPLAALNQAMPGQDLAGMISGSAKVSGKLADPAATFSIHGAGVRAKPLDAAGASPLEIDAAGSYARGALQLDAATVNGPQGLTLTARGRLPFSGEGVDLSVSASAPLALANRLLADRGARATGVLQASATVTGSLAKPSVRGMFSTQGAEIIDPQSNTRLQSIAVMGAIDGDRVTLRNASANLAAGGSIAASGAISLDAAAAFPADIRISLNNARYADGNLVVATVGGTLSVTGPLLRDPLLSGAITVSRAEITVPESFAGGAAALDVKHIKPPKAVAETLRRAKANDGTPTPTARPSVLRLDIAVNAPSRIFVRGRGLDTELGGSVRLTGPLTDIQPVGAFKLIRGRLSILGQRITFDEGEVTLVGDLDPFLNFIARSEGSDITVFVTVSGRVSDISVTFSSQPQLPQDEVLARLIFNRGIGELSAFQIAQLAAAAAELAGGSNNSLIGGLRKATGLDDLDIGTDSQGNAVVRAGRYVQDNVYLGVEAGAEGSTKGTINLDITKDLKAKGAVGASGDSSLGLFYEKDY